MKDPRTLLAHASVPSWWVTALICVGMGAFLIGRSLDLPVLEQLATLDPHFFTSGFIVVIFTSVLSVVVIAMSRFLATDPIESEGIRDDEFKSLKQTVANIERLSVGLTEDTSKELVDSLRDRIKTEAADQFLNEIRERVRSDEFTMRLAARTQKCLTRIYAEIASLGKRGTVNLILGVTTAMVGVTALSMSVIFASTDRLSLDSFAITYLPRLSIVVIIEVFSYFFLRLYKASLSEIKYFQNEATNIEFNCVALDLNQAYPLAL